MRSSNSPARSDLQSPKFPADRRSTRATIFSSCAIVPPLSQPLAEYVSAGFGQLAADFDHAAIATYRLQLRKGALGGRRRTGLPDSCRGRGQGYLSSRALYASNRGGTRLRSIFSTSLFSRRDLRVQFVLRMLQSESRTTRSQASHKHRENLSPSLYRPDVWAPSPPTDTSIRRDASSISLALARIRARSRQPNRNGCCLPKVLPP
jgi:hypothetical protein